jgi:hypothetical protein
MSSLSRSSEKDKTYLIFRGRTDADTEASTPNRLNNLTLTIAAKNQTTTAGIFFHGSAKGRLRLTTKSIDLHENNRLELGSRCPFLSTSYSSNIPIRRHFLYDILHNKPVIISCIPRG